ncbi:MAG: T9SS type A sorting domain-containing protein [Flavobacteriales bacterium]|nr:T9SS type A sorting domain-containing protein [Flavobacteriales bacterium]
MKKTLLSFLMFGAVGIYTASAQITVTDADIVSVGDNVEQAHDTLPSVTIGSSGASQTWNFSSISQHTLDTMKFRDPSTFPNAQDFPLSNIGVDESQDSSWIFLTKNASGLFIDGQSQYQQGQLISIPIVSTIITFPSTMGTSFNGHWNGDLIGIPVGQDLDGPGPQGVIDSIKITRDATLTSNIDGWGNVTTPYGTFASLRQIAVEEDADTTWQKENGTWSIVSPTTIAVLNGFGFNIAAYSFDTTRTARWWSNDPSTKFPVVEMDYEANGTVNNVDWLKSAPTVGVNEQAAAPVSVALYPNPAKDVVTITTSISKGSIDVLDVTGRLIKTIRIYSNSTSMNVSNYENSIYFYNVKDDNGATVYSAKFVVNK